MHQPLSPTARRRLLTRVATAMMGIGFMLTASAQADGMSAPVAAPLALPSPSAPSATARIAALNAPGGALMNALHDRMRQIQATQDPALRQRRMDEFLPALQAGMQNISKPTAAAGR